MDRLWIAALAVLLFRYGNEKTLCIASPAPGDLVRLWPLRVTAGESLRNLLPVIEAVSNQPPLDPLHISAIEHRSGYLPPLHAGFLPEGHGGSPPPGPRPPI